MVDRHPVIRLGKLPLIANAPTSESSPIPPTYAVQQIGSYWAQSRWDAG